MLPAVARVFFSRGSLFEEGMGLMLRRLFAGSAFGGRGPEGRIRNRMGVLMAASVVCALVLVCSCEAAFAGKPPVIEEQYATDVAGTSATIGATVNPEGSATTYHFEYGPSSSYGSSTPQTNAGSGVTGITAQAHLQGLSPATVYHYRLVASNAGGTVEGADQTFTTQGAGGEPSLLDGRQWELVSPPTKQGASILPIDSPGLIQAAEDGHAITYVTSAPTESEPQGNGYGAQIVSSRNSGAWSSKDIATYHAVAKGSQGGFEYRFFSPDLSLALVEPTGTFTPLSSEATEQTEYVRRNAECETSIATCYTPLVSAANLPPGTKASESQEFVGATADLSHVVLQSVYVGLTSTPGDEGGLYEWVAGQLRLVSVLPESEGGTPASYAALGSQSTDARNAISDDGSRIFWTVGGRLYLRDVAREETVRIGTGEARFQLANPSGSRVLFRAEYNGPLEVCDIVEANGKLACRLSQLAPSVEPTVLGASEDGSYVYFVSNAALAPGAVSGTCSPFGSTAADRCNLYVAHEGSAGWESPKLIGVLSAADAPDWSRGNDTLETMTARVSPDGRWLAFMSQRNLTGYDTRDAVSGQSDEEVYLYDASTERLTCASCNPTGGRPHGTRYGNGNGGDLLGGGDRVWTKEAWLASNIPGWTPYRTTVARYQSRYLSASGRLFFNSGDALVPQDVNGTWDVYEYEPSGIGSCSTANRAFSVQADGCIDLVSSGDSPEQSAFMDASESGDDVFFLAANHLATQDFDTSYDLYDAHVCSASAPCTSSLATPPPCSTGDSCKAAPSPQPSVFGAPPSATFSGVGNLPAAPEGVKRRSVSKAQRLRLALKACHRKKGKRRRTACERRARMQYRAKKTTRGSK